MACLNFSFGLYNTVLITFFLKNFQSRLIDFLGGFGIADIVFLGMPGPGSRFRGAGRRLS